MSHIVWHKVTWYSKLAAVILGLLIFALGIWLGMQIQQARDQSLPVQVYPAVQR